MNQITMGRNIKYLRKYYRMTQKELAEKIKASDKAVSAWERGEREPKMGYVQRLADLFNISTDTLMDGELSDLVKPSVKSDGDSFNLSSQAQEFVWKYEKLSREHRAIINQMIEALATSNQSAEEQPSAPRDLMS